jgi:hypothetical protein
VIIESPIVPVNQIQADGLLKATVQEGSPFGIALGGKDLELYILRTMLPFDNLNPGILNRTSLLLAKNADLLEKRISRVVKDSNNDTFGPCKNCSSLVFSLLYPCPRCGFFERKPRIWDGRVVGPPPPSDEELPPLIT